MSSSGDVPSLDALADAVAARLAGRRPPGPYGPTGEPDLELPPGWRPPGEWTGPHLSTAARLRIAGIEYTQSVQHSGAVPPSYDADNAVPLVAYKPLVVRVYPEALPPAIGTDNLTGERITGELTLSIGDRVILRTGPTRAAGCRVGPVSAIDRMLWDREFAFPAGDGRFAPVELAMVNCPLNFIVPAMGSRPGRIYVTIQVWPVAAGRLSSQRATKTGYLSFLRVGPPKVCLVRVNWTDANGMRWSPSDTDMLATTTLAERMLPFPHFETTILGIEKESSAAFGTAGTNGDCNAAWSNLLVELNVTRIFTALFQLGSIVYGMVPANAIPASGKFNAGCGGGVAGGFVGRGGTFAHEVGHLYEREHVGVDGDSDNDPNYPNYGGSTTSIGEVGVDVGTSPPTLFDPAATGDIMSYADQRWISPYTYRGILDSRGLHQSGPVAPRRRDLVVVDFRLYREGLTAPLSERRVEIRSVTRLVAPGPVPAPPRGAPSPVSIDLIDADRRVLATHHCTYIASRGDGCAACGPAVPLDREPWLDFTEVVEWPDLDAIAALSFHQGGEPLFALDAGEPPSVAIEGPERGEGTLTVRVEADHPTERPSVLVLFTSDGGESWQPVAFNPPEGTVTVPNDRLTGGERCSFRAVASAALRTSTADTEPFELPRTGRRVWIDAPGDDCPVPPGPVRLTALVDTRGLGLVEPRHITWTSDLDGELGHGYTVLPDLTAGRHEVTVVLPDGLGGTLSQRGIIVVGG